MQTLYPVAVHEFQNVDLSVSAFEISHHWLIVSSHEASVIRNPSSLVEKNHKFVYDSFWKWGNKPEKLFYGT